MDPLAAAASFLAGGARLLQLRAKALSDERFLALAEAMARAAEAAGGQLIVNDRADVAWLAGAHGVHVGQDDLDVAEVRRIAGDAAIVGVSTHTPAQVAAALATDATYIAVGPVFATGTKDTGYAPVGLELVAAAARSGRRVVGIGGITLENAPLVMDAGAWAVAVISDLMRDDDPGGRARAYCEALARRGPR